MPSTSPRTGTTTSRVNLRKGPGTNFNVIVTLPTKTSVLILEEQGEWYKVSVNGQEGFVNQDFVLLPTQKVLSGFLIHRPEAQSWQLAPSVKLAAPAGSGKKVRDAANIWNKYGGLLEPLAAMIKIDPAVAGAVVATESGGSGFKDGKMIIRFENHHFWKHWGQNNPDKFNANFRFDAKKPWKGHQFRASANKPWQSVHVDDQGIEWMVFDFAAALNEHAAKMSISMGLPQILGSNCTSIGYDTAEEMFDAFSTDERTQLIALFDFIQGPHTISTAVSALQRKDFVAFAAFYNGKSNAAVYGEIIRGNFEAFRALKPAS